MKCDIYTEEEFTNGKTKYFGENITKKNPAGFRFSFFVEYRICKVQ